MRGTYILKAKRS